MYNRLEWVELFALAELGGVIVPVNYMLAAAEMTYIVEDSGARWIVAEQPFAEPVAQVVADLSGRTVVEVGEPFGLGLPYESYVADGPLLPGSPVPA